MKKKVTESWVAQFGFRGEKKKSTGLHTSEKKKIEMVFSHTGKE